MLLSENKSSALLTYLNTKEIDLSDEDQIGNNKENAEELSRKYAPPLGDEQVLKRIQEIATEIGSKTVRERIRLAKYLARNPACALLVKKKAKYICQICGVVPFIQKNGLPYAEAHHLDELAVARLDNPLRMICVCPTCHRIIHYGNDASLKSRYS